MSLWAPVLTRKLTMKPPVMPSRTAVTALAMAKFQPSAPAVISKLGGSTSGEASQNAMTGPSGTPMARRPAMKGITSHEQNGARPPTRAARMIMRYSRPLKTLAMIASAPLALR